MGPGTKTIELISSVTSATSEADLLARLKAVAGSVGYDQALFGTEMRVPGAPPVQHITSGYPLEYQALYQERSFIARDPTVVHCQTRPETLVWSEQIYSADSYEIMEESHRFGLGHGLSVPVHEPNRVSMLSMARDRPFESAAERSMVMSVGNVLAHCLHVASEKVILPDLLASRKPHLSPRERECFQLVALGKSNWDIGQLLSISEASAAFHVKNVLKKLRVSTRTQAVAIGVALGMIN